MEYNNLIIKELSSVDAKKYFVDLARLRIGVFAEYPYLYAGTEEGEKKYLETYFQSPSAKILLVLDNKKVCGMATLIPLKDETEDLKVPFKELNLDYSQYLYFGEAILLPEYRGQKIAGFFMDYAVKMAKKLALSKIAFLTVQREENHQHKPPNYIPIERTCKRYGFEQIENCAVEFIYKSSISLQDEKQRLNFWEKILK